jgi:hypothetical protein
VKRYVVYAVFLVIGALAVAAGASLVATDGSSGANHVKGSLNGFQENPSIVTTGTGSVDLRIDDEQQVISFELSYSGLEGGAVSQAHIHISSRSFNGAVSAFFCGGGTKPAPCPPSGTVTGTITPADVSGPAAQGVEPGSFAELVRAIRAGHTYANVHTARWPGGEIRGQINDSDQRQFER